jgi:4-carboxymuconolactone decarboxylase
VSDPGVPLADLPDDVQALLDQIDQPPINLYRALANQPELLRAWAQIASTLRWKCSTPRALRELLILRVAQLTRAEYEWHHHLAMGRSAGLPDEQVSGLADWRSSTLFDERERAALAYAEGVTAGSVSDFVAADVARHFDPAAIIELTLTVAFYDMVSRVLDALRVDIEA